MSNDNVQSEFDDQNQRAGYCYSAWDNKKNKTIQDLLNDAANEIESL